MKQVTFITGNQNKADYLAECLGFELPHTKIDLDEIQSLDLATVVTHKAMQAYEMLGTPVLVEDVSLEFCALGRLPGTFIKWYIEELGLNRLAELVASGNRSAVARGMFGYYDGHQLKLMAGELRGSIADSPRGTNGFGWDALFVPAGQSLTRAEMDNNADIITYKTIKPIDELRSFLEDDKLEMEQL